MDNGLVMSSVPADPYAGTTRAGPSMRRGVWRFRSPRLCFGRWDRTGPARHDRRPPAALIAHPLGEVEYGR